MIIIIVYQFTCLPTGRSGICLPVYRQAGQARPISASGFPIPFLFPIDLQSAHEDIDIYVQYFLRLGDVVGCVEMAGLILHIWNIFVANFISIFHLNAHALRNVYRNILHGTLDFYHCVFGNVVDIQYDFVDPTLKCHLMSTEILCVYVFCSSCVTDVDILKICFGWCI